ncbi:MAG: T9SS type A sorting domain-containing protein [Bacteroidia bacterium]|nr:T9SS type A sorting domain-containing protein [Bacteroidia bacterium]
MNKLYLSLLISLLINHLDCKSQTIGGGEVYYELLSPKKYLVKAIVYRQCSDASLNGIDGYVESDSFKTSMNLKRISISKPTDTCGNPCNNTNAQGNPGYEKHVFIDTVDFTKAPYTKYVNAGNCKIYFSIDQNLRDTNINTIVPGKFYINAMTNICQNITVNHTPEFYSEPYLLACCNQPFIYNAGVIDTAENDSLFFSLEPPLSDNFTPLQYNGNLYSKIPMTPYCPPSPGVVNCRALPNAKPPRGFYFDPETGDINFTPIKCDEFGVIKILVNEFRKDSANKFILIGQVSREMMIQVKVCPDNNPPYFTGNNKYAVCEGNKICFTIGTKDDPFLPKQTKLDTISLSWNKGIMAGTFTIKDSTAREKEALFCWQTKIGDARPNVYSFSATVKDNNCPYPGISTRGYNITVKPKAQSKRTYTQFDCGWLKMEAKPLDSLKQMLSNYVYSFSIRDSSNSGTPLYFTYKQLDSFKFKRGGKYIIEHYVNNKQYNCPTSYLDTVIINALDVEIAIAQDTLICQNDSVQFQALNLTSNPSSIKWFDSEISALAVDSGLIYKSKLKGLKKTIRVDVIHNNCFSSDSVKVYSRGAFETDPSGHLFNYCSINIDTIRIKQIKGTAPFTIEWYKDNQFAGSDSSLEINIVNNTKIKLKITDSTNCSAEDTMLINIIPTPKIGMLDTSICINDTALILSKVDNSNIYFDYYWELEGQASAQKGENFNLIIKDTVILKLRINTRGACESEKSITITPLPLPDFEILSDTIFNKLDFIKMSLDKQFSSYNWSNGTQTINNDFWAYTLGNPGYYTIWCEVEDSNACSHREEIVIRTDGRTTVTDFEKAIIRLYPNPVENYLTIETNNLYPYDLIGVDGKTVLTGELQIGRNQINLEKLSPGIYFIKIDHQVFIINKTQ